MDLTNKSFSKWEPFLPRSQKPNNQTKIDSNNASTASSVVIKTEPISPKKKRPTKKTKNVRNKSSTSSKVKSNRGSKLSNQPRNVSTRASISSMVIKTEPLSPESETSTVQVKAVSSKPIASNAVVKVEPLPSGNNGTSRKKTRPPMNLPHVDSLNTSAFIRLGPVFPNSQDKNKPSTSAAVIEHEPISPIETINQAENMNSKGVKKLKKSPYPLRNKPRTPIKRPTLDSTIAAETKKLFYPSYDPSEQDPGVSTKAPGDSTPAPGNSAPAPGNSATDPNKRGRGRPPTKLVKKPETTAVHQKKLTKREKKDLEAAATKKYKKPRPILVPITARRLTFGGSFFSYGDIVSLVGEDEGELTVYFAQIHGLLQDQYDGKYACITWLLPTTASTKGRFDPWSYTIGPEDPDPRDLECLEFVCHAPNEYYMMRDQPIQSPDDIKLGYACTSKGFKVVRLPAKEFDTDDELIY